MSRSDDKQIQPSNKVPVFKSQSRMFYFECFWSLYTDFKIAFYLETAGGLSISGQSN